MRDFQWGSHRNGGRTSKKSLDDFQKIFLAKGRNTGPPIFFHTLDELVQDLSAVTPNDWATFLHDRVDKIKPRADLAGIEQGGYKLVYKDKPSPSERTISAVAGSGGTRGRALDCWYSIGLRIGADGSIADVLWNGPADKVRLAPGEKVLGVNGQIFPSNALSAAIGGAKRSTEPIHLIVQADSFRSNADIDYHDGERYPVLERVGGRRMIWMTSPSR